jgi:hypothetical protein
MTAAKLRPLLHQIDLAIQMMDNAFRSIGDLVEEEHPLYKDYQTMIAGAVRTKRALARANKELEVF